MSQVKGTSSAPLIMGIIGGVIGLPSALCSGVCGAAVGSALSASANEAAYSSELSEETINQIADTASAGGNAMLALGIIAVVLGIIGGVMGKNKPSVAGGLLMVAAVLSLIPVFMGNLLSFVVFVLFLIGGIISFTQKKVAINE